MELVEPERADERRHEEDARRRRRTGPPRTPATSPSTIARRAIHQTSIQTPIAARSTAKPIEHRSRRAVAGAPCRRARRPSQEIRPARPHRLHVAVHGEEDRPLGGDQPDRRERRRHRGPLGERDEEQRSGTMMIPPPTPNSAPKNPAARPMRTSAHGPIVRAVAASLASPSSRTAGRDPARRRRHARADRRAARRGASPTSARRSSRAGRALRARRLPQRPPGEDAARRRRRRHSLRR